MFKNYLKVSLRSIKRSKAYSFINVVGLASGMACCLLILLWVWEEINYDRFHKNADEIYRVITVLHGTNQDTYIAKAPNPIGPTMKRDYPEVVNFTRFCGGPTMRWLVRYGDKSFLNDMLGSADPSFFEMFTFPFVKGDPETAFKDIHSVVITERMAKKYFGDEDPIGKVLKIVIWDFKVTGVIKDVPYQSHMQFDYIFPIKNMETMWGENLEDWTRTRIHTFVQLKKGASAAELDKKITGIVKKYQPKANMSVFLQPLTDVHLRSNFDYDEDNVRKESITYIYIFSFIALFILLIACINFINLSTARSADRAKEIGMRKVLGAYRSDIIKQFLGESIVITFISLLLAIVLFYLFLPLFFNVSGKHLALTQNFLGNIKILLGLIGIALLTGITAGSYPALFISSFKPTNAIKGASRGGNHFLFYLRKILVVVQFTIAIILIIGTIIIYNQLNYIRNMDLGFDKENLLAFKAPPPILQKYDVLRDKLLKNPNILEMTQGNTPVNQSTLWSDFNWEGKSPHQEVRMILCWVHYGYLKTLKMKMVKGRWFSKEFPTDRGNYVLNEAAVKAIGMQSPLGKRFSWRGQEGTIIGVVKDCHLGSLHHKISPVVFKFGMYPYIMVKIRPENIPQTINFIENEWKQIISFFPFEHFFIDEKIDNIYKSEQQMGSLFKYFTFLAIFISCLGLLGMTSHVTEQRTKEIGTRKVFGASIPGIVMLLLKEFIKLVIVALIIAIPLAWYIMNKWLENFWYRITTQWWMFLLGGALAMIIALSTVAYQTIKAARANPIDSLRYE